MSNPSRKTALIVPLTQPSPAAMRQAAQAACRQGADVVEFRLDFLSGLTESAPAELLKERPLPAIVTCRPARQGGRFAGPEGQRLALLRLAARAGADYLDLELDAAEADGGLIESLRRENPAVQIILSQHDFAAPVPDAKEVLRRMQSLPAQVNKIVFAAHGPEDALAAMAIVRASARPAIALAMGEAGVASRILARKVGAFGTFASLEAGAESAPGQLTVAQMRQLRWDATGPATVVYGVIGCPVAHSMSPAIHNAAFAEAGLDAVYVPLPTEPGEANFNRFIDAVLAAPWADVRGLSVTIPHKENALARAGDRNVDELSRRIGAINTIRLDGDKLLGWNTDYAAATDALCAAMGIAREGLSGRTVAVLGAGGAARAIVAALSHYGAKVAIYNRTVARGEKLAAEFACRAVGLDELPGVDCEIVVNCTSVGMHPRVDDSPLERIPPAVKVVFDTIYNPLETRLLASARRAGCRTVSGLEMFVNQAAAQFEIWTGHKPPRETMRQVVLERLAGTA